MVPSRGFEVSSGALVGVDVDLWKGFRLNVCVVLSRQGWGLHDEANPLQAPAEQPHPIEPKSSESYQLPGYASTILLLLFLCLH